MMKLNLNSGSSPAPVALDAALRGNEHRHPVNVSNPHHRQPQPAANPSSNQEPYRFTDQRVIQQLELAIARSASMENILAEIAQIVSDQTDCLALWVCQTDSGEFGSAQLLTDADGNALWPVVEDLAREGVKRVCRTRNICASPLQSQSQTDLVIAPVSLELDASKPVPIVFVGCFSRENHSAVRQQWLLGLGSQTVCHWYLNRSLKQQTTKTRSLNDAIGLVHALDQSTTISQAAMVVTNHLRRLCQAEQVAISLRQSGTESVLMSVSDVEQVDLGSESNRIIHNACNQASLTNQVLCFPVAENEKSPALLALDKYCKSNGLEACVNYPLITADGRTIGALLIGISIAQIQDENYQEYLGRITNMTAGHFDVVLRANQGLRDLLKRRWNQIRTARLSKIAIIAACAFAVLMAIPMPYRAACDCEVQPVMRRFIAAPYDGILEQTFVESGDLVEQDQVVADLDGRQLRIELSGLRAEYEGAKKRRDSALANGDIAVSQIARSEMERHSAKIELLDQQLANLQVRSPIAGIVVSGDLEKVEGAPLEMGQTLFEIAPLDKMLADIGIPESEIQYIKPGMEVAIKLNAFPFETWTGTIQRIDPRTEIVGDESVFMAQVALPNHENRLRPGMKGSAKIRTTLAPLGWNLFHRPWESVRYWMIW